MIAAVLARLAEIQQAIPDIARAYDRPPYSLPGSDLPAFVNFVGSAAWSGNAASHGMETRTYLMRLYVAPVQEGISGEATARVYPFLERVRTEFVRRPMLGLGTPGSNLDFVTDARWMGDNGIAVMQYASTPYIGAEFRISVETMVPVDILEYD